MENNVTLNTGQRSPYYRGNPKLRRGGINIEYTIDQLLEIKKCKDDPLYFIKNYVKIINVDQGLILFDPYKYQEKMINVFLEHRFSINMLPRQCGKALSLDTPIPTPTGWTNMGDVKVGDEILGRDGKSTKVNFVTETMTNHNCYEITFDNGEKVVADAEHVWKVSNSDWCHEEKNYTTEELLPILQKKRVNGSGLYINNTKPQEFSEKNLGYDPYIFGLWLGDGSKDSARIHSSMEDILEYKKYADSKKIDSLIIEYKPRTPHITPSGLFNFIRTNNIKGNKHIPQVFLRSSKRQRIQLLRGLMDSDGSCTKENGRCEFYQKNPHLIDQVYELISSLGIKARKRIKIIDGQTYHALNFTTRKFYVFNLERKRKNQRMCKNHPKNNRFYIHSIEKVDSVPVKCIQVDNLDHMFLCSRSMIPTHNTSIVAAYMLWVILFQDNQKIAILANKGSLSRDILDRIRMAYSYLPLWMQQGIEEWNKGSIKLENNCSIIAESTSADSVRGQTFNCVFLDEFAHVPLNQQEEFFASVYPTISSGKTTKVIIVSTPKGMNMFYKLWTEAEDGKNSYVPTRVHWTEIPGRDEAWKEETIRNTSETQFNQEQECLQDTTSINIKENGIKKTISIGELYEKLSNQRTN